MTRSDASITDDALASLFEETSARHHDAYAATDGVDPNWALWYAPFVQTRLGDRLGRLLSRSEIVYLLVDADRAATREGVTDWAPFYARRFRSFAETSGVETSEHASPPGDAAEAPRIPYGHLYTDADGVSRHRLCYMTEFERKSIAPPADPQWLGKTHHDGMTVLFTVMPVGWTGTWHENPAPQWIIPLSGAWWVEAMDGERRTFKQGEISFGEDQGTVEQDGKSGHRSGTDGDAPAVLMVVQFDTQRDTTTPCRFD